MDSTPNIWARRSVSTSNTQQQYEDIIKNSSTTIINPSQQQNQADEPFVVYNYMESLPSFTNLKLDPTSKDQSLEEVLPKLCLQQQQNENKIAIKEETEGNNKVSPSTPQNVSNKNQFDEDIADDVESGYGFFFKKDHPKVSLTK